MGQTNDKTSRRSSSRQGKDRAPRFDGARFVQYELDKEELAQCKAWSVDQAAIWLEILPLLEEGYSFTIKWDTFSESFACFVQIRGVVDHANSGCILTGRGSEAWKAVKQAVFKHHAIGASWNEHAERGRVEIDD